jgi:hypothetical protein
LGEIVGFLVARSKGSCFPTSVVDARKALARRGRDGWRGISQGFQRTVARVREASTLEFVDNETLGHKQRATIHG